jgi:hypothetical protein
MSNIQTLYNLLDDVYQGIDVEGDPCFTVFESDFSTVENIVNKVQPSVMLELGSYSGYSSCLLGKQLSQWNGKLICVDNFVDTFDGVGDKRDVMLDKFTKNILNVYPNVKLIQGDSALVHKQIKSTIVICKNT